MITNYIKHYPLSIIVACIVTLISLIPFPEIELAEDIPLADKWTHMVMYGGLCLCIWLEYLRIHENIDMGKTLCLAIAAPILMGGTLELMQAYLTTSRNGDWWDFVANSIGVLVSALIGRTILNKIVPRKKMQLKKD